MVANLVFFRFIKCGHEPGRVFRIIGYYGLRHVVVSPNAFSDMAARDVTFAPEEYAQPSHDEAGIPRHLLVGVVALRASYGAAFVLTGPGKGLLLLTVQLADRPWETWRVLPVAWVLVLWAAHRLSVRLGSGHCPGACSYCWKNVNIPCAPTGDMRISVIRADSRAAAAHLNIAAS